MNNENKKLDFEEDIKKSNNFNNPENIEYTLNEDYGIKLKRMLKGASSPISSNRCLRHLKPQVF